MAVISRCVDPPYATCQRVWLALLTLLWQHQEVNSLRPTTIIVTVYDTFIDCDNYTGYEKHNQKDHVIMHFEKHPWSRLKRSPSSNVINIKKKVSNINNTLTCEYKCAKDVAEDIFYFNVFYCGFERKLQIKLSISNHFLMNSFAATVYLSLT